MTKMSVIRGIFILHLVSFCFSSETTKTVSMKTGNQLAVLRFEGWSISDPLTDFLTEELRETIRELDIFQVQDKGLTNEISIFYPRTKDYWACWSLECAIDLGKRLNVNYIIAGNIQKKDQNEFLINGRLFSVDMETMLNEFSMNSSGITDSLLIEMKKMMYLGEKFVNKARLEGNYKDRTGNLRSSIGYIILLNGKIVNQNFSGKTKGKPQGLEVNSEVIPQEGFQVNTESDTR